MLSSSDATSNSSSSSLEKLLSKIYSFYILPLTLTNFTSNLLFLNVCINFKKIFSIPPVFCCRSYFRCLAVYALHTPFNSLYSCNAPSLLVCILPFFLIPPGCILPLVLLLPNLSISYHLSSFYCMYFANGLPPTCLYSVIRHPSVCMYSATISPLYSVTGPTSSVCILPLVLCLPVCFLTLFHLCLYSATCPLPTCLYSATGPPPGPRCRGLQASQDRSVDSAVMFPPPSKK